MKSKTWHVLLFLVSLTFILQSSMALAKKKKKDKEGENATTSSETLNTPSSLNYRLSSLSPDDQRQFEALTKEQQEAIRAGRIERGFNEWMAKLAKGDPFYGTEHHPVFVDYEQVWLYTREDIQENKIENQIMDPQTNWPTIHRKVTKKKCTIGDFFVLWDRGIVVNIKRDDSQKIYGTCTIENEEAFLPIVNGKPVEPRR